MYQCETKIRTHFDGGLFVRQQLAERVEFKNRDDLSPVAKEQPEFRLQGCKASKMSVGNNTIVYIDAYDFENEAVLSEIDELKVSGLCMIGGAKIKKVKVNRFGHLFIIDKYRAENQIDEITINGSVHRINPDKIKDIFLNPGGRMFIGNYWHSDAQPSSVHLQPNRSWYVEMHDTVMRTKQSGWAFG